MWIALGIAIWLAFAWYELKRMRKLFEDELRRGRDLDERIDSQGGFNVD